jgi:hypothetical protein
VTQELDRFLLATIPTQIDAKTQPWSVLVERTSLCRWTEVRPNLKHENRRRVRQIRHQACSTGEDRITESLWQAETYSAGGELLVLLSERAGEGNAFTGPRQSREKNHCRTLCTGILSDLVRPNLAVSSDLDKQLRSLVDGEENTNSNGNCRCWELSPTERRHRWKNQLVPAEEEQSRRTGSESRDRSNRN